MIFWAVTSHNIGYHRFGRAYCFDLPPVRLTVGAFFLVYGVRLCLRTAATNGPIVLPSDYIWVWGSGGMMILTGENRRTRRKTCPSATLSTTNPTWFDPAANPGLRGERPATNRLSHGTICAYSCYSRRAASGECEPVDVGFLSLD
jgi:hypothetical protein